MVARSALGIHPYANLGWLPVALGNILYGNVPVDPYLHTGQLRSMSGLSCIPDDAHPHSRSSLSLSLNSFEK